MEVVVKHVHGPDGETGHEACEIVVFSSHGEIVRFAVELDAVSSAWITAEACDRDGQWRDVIKAAAWGGAQIGREIIGDDDGSFTPEQPVSAPRV